MALTSTRANHTHLWLAVRVEAEAREVLGWPTRCKLVDASLWKCSSYKGLKLAQLLGQVGVFRFSLDRGLAAPAHAGITRPHEDGVQLSVRAVLVPEGHQQLGVV